MENINQESNQIIEATSFSTEVKQFYQGKFKVIISTFFKNPKDGIRKIFENSSDIGYKNSLILYGAVFILYVVGMYLVLGNMTKHMTFGDFIKIGLIPVVMMLCISAVSFGIKSISGKPNFKNELLTGGICGIPLILLLIGLFALKIFGDSNAMSLMYSPTSGGFLGGLFFIYILVMLINVLQQSLLAAKTKEVFAWYISPVGVLLAGFLAFKVMDGIFS